jgi:16S rRNA (cytosine967-C5)-methyltransferase
MIAPARIAAFEILTAVSAGRLDLASAVAASRPSLHDDRDRALAGEIAAGVQRWRATLDHLIAAYAHRPVSRLDPEVLEILRLSAYQLLYLARVPASAVVDDAVDLTRRAGKRSAAGFVNGVLRTLSRNRRALPLPPEPADPTDRDAALDYLSIALSHPRWLAARWYDRLGFDAARRWMRFNNTAAPVTLRANTLAISVSELEARLLEHSTTVVRGRYAPQALIVREGHPLRIQELSGLFVVQDEASQLIPLLAGPDPGGRVLDACASPGGKTLALAASMSNRGLLVACDVRDKRVQLLRRTVQAGGATNVRIVQADLLAPLPFRVEFDTVLVDVPCSGLGTLRRDPDIRWRRREEDLGELAASELRMLRQAAASVAPGGRLIYATCSSEPEENQAVADAFLATAPGFIPAARLPGVPGGILDDRGRLRTLPHVHGLEAFFGAVFERVGIP